MIDIYSYKLAILICDASFKWQITRFLKKKKTRNIYSNSNLVAALTPLYLFKKLHH